jgi:hypothetical protein
MFVSENRFIWAVSVYIALMRGWHMLIISRIMGQLTLARFRGDTVFGLTARIIATFLGGVTGVVIWLVYSLLQNAAI